MQRHIANGTLLVLAAIVAAMFGSAAMAQRLAAPTIASMSPTSGARGTAVTITGTNLQDATVTWTVAGNPGASGSDSGTMKAAPITANVSPDGTTIMFSVPDGGSSSNGIMAPGGTNRVTITTAGGSVSKLFSVTSTNTLGLKPSITYLMPRHAKAGAQITIFGTHLTTTKTVKIGGMSAKFRIPSDTRILVTIPMRAHSGRWTVTTQYGTATSPSFKVASAVAA
jgi:hypothetical protein